MDSGQPFDAAPDLPDDSQRLKAEIVRLRAEAARNDQFLSKVLEATSEGVITIDATGTILRINAGAQQMFGYSREEVVGQTVDLLIPERFRSEHLRQRESYFHDPNYRELHPSAQFVGLRKDGSEFPAAIFFRYSSNGSGIACDAFVTDSSLRNSERWFRLFVQYAPGAMAMFDREMRYLVASRRWLRDFKIAEDPTGRSQYEIFPVTPKRWKEWHRRGLAGESFKSDSEAIIHSDDRVQWIRWELQPWRDASGAIGGILIAAEDLTAQKEAEQEIRAAKERFELALRGSSDGIWDWNLVTNEIHFSNRVYELLGFEPGEITFDNQAWVSRIHPEDQADALARLQAHLDDGSPFDVQYRLLTKAGNYCWVRSRAAALRDQTGKPLRMAGAVTDITERRLLQQRLEEALQNTDERLRAVIESSPLAIATMDPYGKITSLNRAGEEMFGYTAAEAIGRVSPAIPASQRQMFHELLMRALSGSSQRVEVERIRKDGSVIEVAIHYTRFLTRPGGEPAGVVVFAEDITLPKRAETELRLNSVRAALAAARDEEARRIARELHDDISQRLAVLSMDMSIDTDLKRAREWKARLQAYRSKLGAITESIRQISHQMHASILDDLGLVKALEQLCFEQLGFEPNSFGASNQWLGFPVSFRAEGVPDDVPKEIASCLYRVTQAALHNVTKHAEAANASVTLKGSPGFIELVVADSGRGFDTSSEQRGLGLASMRERVSQVNGSIAIVSKPGDGTRISAKLPLHRAKQAPLGIA